MLETQTWLVVNQGPCLACWCLHGPDMQYLCGRMVWEPCEPGILRCFASLSSSTLQHLSRLGQSRKGVMLSLLEVLQHCWIIHHRLRTAALAIGKVLLLMKMSFDLLADKALSGSPLGGKHVTIPVFLPTLHPVHQKWLSPSVLQTVATVCQVWILVQEKSCYFMLCFIFFCYTSLWGLVTLLIRKLYARASSSQNMLFAILAEAASGSSPAMKQFEWFPVSCYLRWINMYFYKC